MEKEKEALVRVNTRISADLNDWLDRESSRTGLSNSSIMMIVTENYRREKDAFLMMADIGQLVDKLDDIERAVKSGDHTKKSD